jgi:predicted metal-dependent HD superfamily phosphohydrolase
MNLQNRHSELLLKINFNPNVINGLWLDLEKAYSAKSRQYHNFKHLITMIELFDIHYSSLENPNEVLYSIFYHDYIYKATRKDNELKSAEYSLSILPETVILDKQLVFDAICATQAHQQNEIEDINWLIDFDLKILSTSWEDYQTYCNQIRKEYKIYPTILYKPGRRKALEHFLEREFIYKTATFRNLFDKDAKGNIKREILLLT